MSHEAFRDQLVSRAQSSAGDPSGFLEGLSPIHDAWHVEGMRTYGFLLFHHRVLRYFGNIVGPALAQPITAYSQQDLEAMDVMGFDQDLTNIDALAEMAQASRSIESWHNTAHMGIGMSTGVPMMDPRQNIFFRAFWRLHLFIDELFVTVLQQYGANAHPQEFVTDDAVAAHIETRHHGWVPAI